MGKVLDVEGGTVMNLDQNKVTVTAFQSGFEEGRLAWPKPIPVSEKLPEEYVDVLGWDGRKWDVTCIAEDKSSGMVGWYYIGAGGDDYYDGKSITHWLELPPKPE